MKNLGKLLLVFVMGLFIFGNVYAEEVVVAPDSESVQEETVNSEYVADKDKDGYTVSDQDLLDIAIDSLPEDQVIVTEDEAYRDVEMEIAMDEPAVTDGESGVMDIIVPVVIIAVVVTAGVVILFKSGAIKKVAK